MSLATMLRSTNAITLSELRLNTREWGCSSSLSRSRP